MQKKQETRQKKKEPHCGSFFAVLKRLFVVRHFNACVGERKRRAWVNVAVHLVCVASAVRVFGDKDFARQELASAPTADAASATIGACDACAFERNQHVFVGVARDIVFLIAHLHVQVENFVFCLLRIAGEFPRFFCLLRIAGEFPRFFCRTEQLFAVEFLFDAEFFDFADEGDAHALAECLFEFTREVCIQSKNLITPMLFNVFRPLTIPFWEESLRRNGIEYGRRVLTEYYDAVQSCDVQKAKSVVNADLNNFLS